MPAVSPRPRRSAGTCSAARPRATGPATRTPRWSRSSSRPGTGGRSRCPGRSGPGCSAAPAAACCVGADGQRPRGAGPERATSRRDRASASRLSAASSSSASQVGAGPEAVHVRLARTGVAAQQHAAMRLPSWTRISARRLGAGSPNSAGAVGQDHGQAPDRDAGRAARPAARQPSRRDDVVSHGAALGDAAGERVRGHRRPLRGGGR